MNPILEWAARYGIGQEALTELADILTVEHCEQAGSDPESEAAVSARVRLAASRAGMRLFRNNVGACVAVDDYGAERQVRYGLANESSRVNNKVKSGDLIGITPLTIKPEHLGQVLGIFTSIETKKSDWKYTGRDREVAQKRWIDIIRSLGGIAEFANSDGVINEIRTNFK